MTHNHPQSPTPTPKPPHRSAALDHLAAVQAHADNLREEWRAPRPNPQDVKYLTAAIGRGLKLAEVHAALNIGDQLARIADRIEDLPADALDFLDAATVQRMVGK